MSSSLYGWQRFSLSIREQNECICVVWDSHVRIMKIYSRERLIMGCSGVCLSVFMVPTLSNQKITSPILLDLFLMAFFSGKIKKKEHPHITSLWHKDTDMEQGFISFLLGINEMQELCQLCILAIHSSSLCTSFRIQVATQVEGKPESLVSLWWVCPNWFVIRIIVDRRLSMWWDARTVDIWYWYLVEEISDRVTAGL